MTNLHDYPEGSAIGNQIQGRHRRGNLWRRLFQGAIVIAIFSLIVLVLNILNSMSGLAAIENEIHPDLLVINGEPLEDQSAAQLHAVLRAYLNDGVLLRIEREKPFVERNQQEIYDIVLERVVNPEVQGTWTVLDSLTKRDEIEAEVALKYPNAELSYRQWLTMDFITRAQSSRPELAGVRTAIYGSLWTIVITLFFSLPIGVGAAIYLEEYATDTFINRIIKTNISNLAGVPSIIYGMLGLAIFVNAMGGITGGRTILSAGLTLGLLILPLIIINGQEAIRAVPNSLSSASYGLGATKWQTIWSHVLPSALPGILTGTILAISRAIGETAPLIVVGASTFIAVDPTGPFSKFTTLPIQIFDWTSRPQPEFQNIAAAAIVVLLILLLTLNASAVFLRNRFARRG